MYPSPWHSILANNRFIERLSSPLCFGTRFGCASAPNLGSLFLQSGFCDAVFHYMRGFGRDFVMDFAVNFSVDLLSFVSRDKRTTEKTYDF